jgi:hypothetical protein
VVTIKSGAVRIKMTAGPRGILAITPDRIAPALFAARSKARGVVYLPRYWHLIVILPTPLRHYESFLAGQFNRGRRANEVSERRGWPR